jgi:hypothetical protein
MRDELNDESIKSSFQMDHNHPLIQQRRIFHEIDPIVAIKTNIKTTMSSNNP